MFEEPGAPKVNQDSTARTCTWRERFLGLLPAHKLYLAGHDGGPFALLDRERVFQLVGDEFTAFTVSDALGSFEGRRLHTLIVTVATSDPFRVDRLARTLCRQFRQKAVGHEAGGLFREVMD